MTLNSRLAHRPATQQILAKYGPSRVVRTGNGKILWLVKGFTDRWRRGFCTYMEGGEEVILAWERWSGRKVQDWQAEHADD